MEILRFEEAPSGAPKRKKSSRSFLALGLVATLFGISTAFATTTININADAPISLGQGVNTFTACDTAVGLNPVTSLKDDLASFQFEELVVGYDYADGLAPEDGHQIYTIDSHEQRITDPDKGLGCGGVDFKVKFYNSSSTPLTCSVLLGTIKEYSKDLSDYLDVTGVNSPTGEAEFKCQGSAIYFKVPNNGLSATQTTFRIKFLALPSPDFFDHVTLETTSGIDYTAPLD